MARPARRQPSTNHLVTDGQLDRVPGVVPPGVRHTRGQGNGVRVHGVYILVVSVIVLVAFVVCIAIASGHMM